MSAPPLLPLLDHDDAPRKPASENVFHRYYFDVAYLQRAQQHLTGHPAEAALLGTGVRVPFFDEKLVISVPTSGFIPTYEYQEVTGLKADPLSVHRVLRDIYEKKGLHLLCRFHSHPGPGREQAYASHTDLQDQLRWEQQRYTTVSGVFTRTQNGRFFVKLFTCELPISIRIVGNATKVERDVWEISAIEGV